MHFGENQLSPGSISISPLPTGHPTALQRRKVRASTRSYPRFTLPMGSSPGFGSTSSDSCALFRLAFAPAPRPSSLNLATERNSSAHSSIGTPSPGRSLAPTACRHTVSGTISLPSRGAFHLSLTVLVHYRSPKVFSLGKWSPQIPTGFLVSRGTQDPGRSRPNFVYGTLTRCGVPFQAASTIRSICDSCTPVLQPRRHIASGLGCSPFARRY